MKDVIGILPERIQTQIDALAARITDKFVNLLETTESITEKHIEDHEGKWNEIDQYFKVVEEAVEAQKAWNRNYPNKDEEHLDILFALLTLFHIKKFKREEILLAITICLKKFHERGWLF